MSTYHPRRRHSSSEALRTPCPSEFLARQRQKPEIRDSRLYQADHATFEDYCQKKWGWQRQRAYELIEAARTVKALPVECNKNITNDAQARALTKVEPEKRVAVLEKAAISGNAIAQGSIP